MFSLQWFVIPPKLSNKGLFNQLWFQNQTLVIKKRFFLDSLVDKKATEDTEESRFAAEKASCEAEATIKEACLRLTGHWIALVCSNINKASDPIAHYHIVALARIGQQWVIVSSIFTPPTDPSTKIRVKDIGGMRDRTLSPYFFRLSRSVDRVWRLEGGVTKRKIFS